MSLRWVLYSVLVLSSGALFAGCSGGGGSSGGGGGGASVLAPSAPGGLQGIFANERVALTWVDHSNNEAGFHVERRVAGIGSFTVVASVAIGHEAYTDVGVSTGSTYEYRVTAHNSAGSNSSQIIQVVAPAGAEGEEPSGGGVAPGPSGPISLSVTINLSIGIGLAGFAGDGGLALNGQINGAEGVSLDASGNVFLADTLNNRIRRVDAATGILTTLGGTGAAGFSGDGGAASSATFNGPSDLAVDALGNVYVADRGNNRVRRIDSAGQVTTLAGTGAAGFSGDGGPAAAAALNSPNAVALDAAGNRFVSDSLNQRVRRIDAQTGVISTVAGDGTLGFSGDGGPGASASLSGPADLAIDQQGRLYIADAGNNRVRRLDRTGVISTLAGTGSAGFSGDGGAATAAELSGPAGLTLDPAGNLYIADRGNNRIRRVTAATGALDSVAGSGTAGYSGDGGLATQAQLNGPGRLSLDPAGRLVFVDPGNDRVRVLARLKDLVITTASLAPIAIDRPVRRVLEAEGGTGTGLAWSLVGGSLPAGLTLTSEGSRATLTGSVGSAASPSLTFEVRDSSGAIATRVLSLVASAPRIATRAGNGVAGFGGDGAQATLASFGAAASGIAVTSSGDLVFADTANHRVRRVVAATGVIETVAGNGISGSAGDGGAATSANLNGPRGVGVDAAGNLFIADTGNNRVRRVDFSTGRITTVAGTGVAGFSGDGGVGTGANLNGPRDVSVGPSGDLFIADTGNLRVRRVQALTGRITTYAGTGLAGLLSALGDGGAATSAVLNSPVALELDASGNLFVVDQLSFRVRRVDGQSGVMTTVAGSGLVAGFGGDGGQATLAILDSPSDVAVDEAGNVFIADRGNNRLRQVTSAGVISTLSGDGTSGFSGDGGPATGATLSAPTSLASGRGALHLVDQSNHRIRTVSSQ